MTANLVACGEINGLAVGHQQFDWVGEGGGVILLERRHGVDTALSRPVPVHRLTVALDVGPGVAEGVGE